MVSRERYTCDVILLEALSTHLHYTHSIETLGSKKGMADD
jgi:hypothetical protein